MVNCVNCGHEYSAARLDIGYRTCLTCGDKTASKQTQEKASRCMPAFNKGGYQYVQDVKTILTYDKREKR